MIDVVKTFVRRGDKYLMLKRNAGKKHFPNHWDFPGGHCEPPEDIKTCAERRIIEETGLNAKALEEVASYEMDIEDAGHPTHRYHVYDTKSYFGEVRMSAEHTEYQWMTQEEILALELLEPYIRLYFEEHPE